MRRRAASGLADTDTKSYVDMIKILAHLSALLGPSIVLVIMGDGQTVVRLRDAKKKYPAAFKHVLRRGFSPPALPCCRM